MNFRRPTPGAAMALFILTLVLNVIVSTAFFQMSPDLGVVLAEPVAILLPTLLAVRLLKVDGARTLRFKMPTAADLLLALPLAFSLAVLNDQLTNLTGQFFPMSEEFLERMTDLLRADTTSEWVTKLLGIGLGAAMSEELLFRGFLLTALEKSRGRGSAIVLTTLLFAIMHLIPQGLPSYALAGAVLGITALASESIWVPILIHFTNNMSAVALLSLADMESLGRPVWIPAGILLPALLIFALTLGHFVRKLSLIASLDKESPAEPAPGGAGESSGSWRRLEPAPGASLPRDDVEGIPEARRRLGWLTVGCAVVIGTSIILGLFVWSIYHMNPDRVKAGIVAGIEQEVLGSLGPEEQDLAPRVRQEFQALQAAGESGHLGFWKLLGLTWTYAQYRADGAITRSEVESLLQEVRRLQESSTGLRRL